MGEEDERSHVIGSNGEGRAEKRGLEGWGEEKTKEAMLLGVMEKVG